MNSPSKVAIGLAVVICIVVGWACRFQVIPQQPGFFYIMNRWTGQVYLVEETEIHSVPYK